ncbi:hypothetical protein RB653_006770 [Dictyostelium firmibasis]|uniref:C2 domain-containing protein n=1 Tax=Dictyostelium firmibasis TaxID=79012 RepID=A0AAN7TTK0_9MYCE
MAQRSLKINIIEGKDLKGLDSGGVSDCYIKFKCGPISAKTEVIKKSTSPIWNHMINIGYVEENTLLQFECFDWERIGTNRTMGKTQAFVSDFSSGAKRNLMDQWLRLDSKGFIRVSYEFIPPYPLETTTVEQQPMSPNVSTTMGMYNPPPVYFKPIFLPTIPMEILLPTSKTNHNTTTTCKFIMPGSVYQTKPFVSGEFINCSLVINVYEPRIVVRSLNLSFSGSITYKGRTQRKLVNDYRDLLLGYTGGVNNSTTASGIITSNKVVLERGKHVFPFQFFIDKSCKSTVDITGYRVGYYLSFHADIVNLPDIGVTEEIKVVNLEDTIYKQTISPINVQTSKSPLSGGNISISCKSVKNSFYPGEEVELEVEVNNSSKKKIKNIDIQFVKVEYDGTDLTGSASILLSMTKSFYPKIKQNTSCKQMIVIELPSRNLATPIVHSLSETKMMRVEYHVLVNLDIPSCVDLRLKLPLNIVQPDPKLETFPNPLTEIGSLPRYIKDWTVKNFYSWILFKKLCPEVISLNPEFYQYDLTGSDLMQLPTETFYSIFKGAGQRTQELVNDLQSQIFEIQSVRNFLKELQLSNLIDFFEKQTITWDILLQLTYNDIYCMKDMTLGDAKRIFLKIEKIRNEQQQILSNLEAVSLEKP